MCSKLKYELKGSIQDLVHYGSLDGSLLMLRVGSSPEGALTHCIIKSLAYFVYFA